MGEITIPFFTSHFHLIFNLIPNFSLFSNFIPMRHRDPQETRRVCIHWPTWGMWGTMTCPRQPHLHSGGDSLVHYHHLHPTIPWKNFSSLSFSSQETAIRGPLGALGLLGGGAWLAPALPSLPRAHWSPHNPCVLIGWNPLGPAASPLPVGNFSKLLVLSLWIRRAKLTSFYPLARQSVLKANFSFSSPLSLSLSTHFFPRFFPPVWS